MEWVGTPVVLGSSAPVQYALVTTALAGLQFVWSIEQAYFNIYLLDLGMTKSSLSLMWIAGPLCGLLVQPIIGVISDSSTNKHGRRRPFMIWGALAVALGLFVFGWTKDLSERYKIDAVKLGVAAVLLVDVAVNVCQACTRALIVDSFPGNRQTEANGWASRMASIGHLVSYYLGSVDLTVLGFSSQIKAAAVIYSTVLVVCVSISSAAVKERVLVKNLELTSKSAVDEIEQMAASLWSAAVNLDFELKAIFKVQMFAWYAWFTFLFYGSTYASEVWKGSNENTQMLSTGEMARAGSLALAVFSLSSTVSTIILPRLRQDIVDIWTVSFIVYAVAVVSTHWASTYNVILLIFGIVGFSWAATLWVPFALTSKRIHELPNLPRREPPSDAERQSLAGIPTGRENTLVEDEIPPTLHLLNNVEVTDAHDEQSGIILGMHNTALTLPQFLSTFGSYVIFRLLDTDPQHPHSDGGRAIAVTLQVGAITAILAAIYSRKIKSLT